MGLRIWSLGLWVFVCLRFLGLQVFVSGSLVFWVYGFVSVGVPGSMGFCIWVCWSLGQWFPCFLSMGLCICISGFMSRSFSGSMDCIYNHGKRCCHYWKFLPLLPLRLLNVVIPNSLHRQSLSVKGSELKMGKGASKNAAT